MIDTNPYEPSASPAQSTPPSGRVSYFRGCGFGCLYTVVTWIGLGFVVALLIPVVFRGPDWNHRELGNFSGQLIFWLIAVPAGIFGFVRNRRISVDSGTGSPATKPKKSVDFGIVAGWLLLGAIIGVVIAIARDTDAEDSADIVFDWTMGGGVIGLILFVLGRVFGRRRSQ